MARLLRVFKEYMKQQMINKLRQLFLLSFFSEDSGYMEKEINNFWLIKQFDSLQNEWQVAIYLQKAYLKRKKHEFRIKNLISPRRNNASENK